MSRHRQRAPSACDAGGIVERAPAHWRQHRRPRTARHGTLVQAGRRRRSSTAVKGGGWSAERNAVRPSPSGEHARKRWLSFDAGVAASVAGGSATPLREVVRQFFLEWPRYPSGYGPAGRSITGGIYVSGGGTRDSKVPPMASTGRRSPGPTSGEQASLAWPLRLAVEGVRRVCGRLRGTWFGGLHLAASALRLLPDEGVPVRDVPMLSRLKGDGKSVLERHGYIEIWRDAGKPTVALAVPTARHHITRDKYKGPSGWSRMARAPSPASTSSLVYSPRSSPSISTDRCPTQ